MFVRTAWRKIDVNECAGRGDDHPWLTFIHSSEACRTRGRVRTTALVSSGALDVSIHWRSQRTYTVYPLR